MNAPKATGLDSINFLLAAPCVVTCTEAGRVQPDGPRQASHDALTHLLQRLEPNVEPLWLEMESVAKSLSPMAERTFVHRASEEPTFCACCGSHKAPWTEQYARICTTGRSDCPR